MSTSSIPNKESSTDPYVIHFGHDELLIRRRYEVISIANDILIVIWFLIGTIFFFFNSMVYAGTWLFLLGSIEMLIRPTIRFIRRVHLSRFHPHVPGTADAAHDF